MDAVQRYFLVVFDVTNNSDTNEELSFSGNSIELKMNKTKNNLGCVL